MDSGVAVRWVQGVLEVPTASQWLQNRACARCQLYPSTTSPALRTCSGALFLQFFLPSLNPTRFQPTITPRRDPLCAVWPYLIAFDSMHLSSHTHFPNIPQLASLFEIAVPRTSLFTLTDEKQYRYIQQVDTDRGGGATGREGLKGGCPGPGVPASPRADPVGHCWHRERREADSALSAGTSGASSQCVDCQRLWYSSRAGKC